MGPMAVDDDDNEADEGEHEGEVYGRESPLRVAVDDDRLQRRQHRTTQSGS